jgi:hypothetical protein
MALLLIFSGAVVFAVLAALSFRWLQVQERIGIEAAKAGGDERAKVIDELQRQVKKIEGYISGEDIRQIEK